MDVLDIENIKKKLDSFAQDRGWEKFHNPKNLAMALSVEAAELLELFQWYEADQCLQYKNKEKEKVEDELADIFLYGIRMASKLDINLLEAIERKMIKNEKKYPISESRELAKKLDQF